MVTGVSYIAVVDQDVETVPLASHEDHEGQWVTHVYRLGHPLTPCPVPLSDLHVAGRRRQSEVHGVLSVHSSNST